MTVSHSTASPTSFWRVFLALAFSTSILLLAACDSATAPVGTEGQGSEGEARGSNLSLVKVGGDRQVGASGATLPDLLVVRVTNPGGQPRGGVAIQWQVEGGDGSLAVLDATTRDDGTARARFTLGAPNKDRVVARIQSGDAVTFTLDVLDAPPVTDVRITQGPSALSAIGSTTTLSAELFDAAGAPAGGETLLWSSLDGDVATVDEQGTVTAISNGTARIVASAACCLAADTVQATVAQLPASISFGVGSLSLAVGATSSVSAVVRDANEHPIDGVAAEWTIDAPDIAQVDQAGVVTGMAAGSAVVSASIGDVTATLPVTVISSQQARPQAVSDLRAAEAATNSVTLEWTQVEDGSGQPANYEIRWTSTAAGSTQRTEGAPKYVSGWRIGEKTRFTWTGLDEGKRYDFHLVAFRLESDGSHTNSDPSNIATASTAVSEGPPAQISDLRVVSSTSGAVTLAWTQVDDGAGSPARYAVQTASPSFGATGAQESMEHVTGNDIGTSMQHTRTGLTAGTEYQFQVVPYRLTDDGSAVAGDPSGVVSATTEDRAQEASRIEITPASLSVQEGQSAVLGASVLDQNGSPISGASIAWSVSDPSIIQVDASGVVTARAVGTASVYATSGLLRGTATVQVTAPPPPPPPPSTGTLVLDWNYADRDALRADPMARVSDVFVDGNGGRIAREEIVDVTGQPWGGPAKALRVNYDGTGDNDGRIGGEQYGGAVRFIPGVLGDGRGGAAEPRHVWIRTWAYMAPNFDGWGWKMLHLRSPTGTRTEVKPYRESMHPVIDNNSSWQTDYIARDVGGQDRGRWVEIRVERKLADDGRSNGIFRVQWQGQMVADYVNIAPARDSESIGGFTAFHQNIAFGLNTGPTRATYVLWGPAEVSFTDPGWSW